MLLKIRPDAEPQAMRHLDEALASLQDVIPGLLTYSWGPNVSPENLGRGYNHGFVMTFENTAARDAYLPHPEHQKVGPLVGAVAEEVLVFDLEVSSSEE